jgi:hypothetical protein
MVSGRVAILGGDGRNAERWAGLGEYEVYLSRDAGGNGEFRRLEAAVRSGTIRRVVVLARFNGHSGLARLRLICKERGVSFEVMLGSNGRRLTP